MVGEIDCKNKCEYYNKLLVLCGHIHKIKTKKVYMIGET